MLRRLGVAPHGVTPFRPSHPGDQRGMVTVELAVGFVTATLLAAVLVGLVMLGVGQAACARASTEMARQLSRGDADAAARAEQEAPRGARNVVARDDDGVAVTVTAPVAVFGIGFIDVSATAWSRYEPGVRR